MILSFYEHVKHVQKIGYLNVDKKQSLLPKQTIMECVCFRFGGVLFVELACQSMTSMADVCGAQGSRATAPF